MLGAAVAAGLMRLDWFGWHGWRWLLILEGFPAVLLGVVAFFYLTDRPKDARWLPETSASGSPPSSNGSRSGRRP